MDRQMRMGGVGDIKEPDSNVNEICEKIRDELEKKCGKQFTEFTPIRYKTQLVNGVNYFIKVRVNDGEYIHIRVHKSFGGDITFASHEENKSLEEDVIFFELKEGNE